MATGDARYARPVVRARTEDNGPLGRREAGLGPGTGKRHPRWQQPLEVGDGCSSTRGGSLLLNHAESLRSDLFESVDRGKEVSCASTPRAP